LPAQRTEARGTPAESSQALSNTNTKAGSGGSVNQNATASPAASDAASANDGNAAQALRDKMMQERTFSELAEGGSAGPDALTSPITAPAEARAASGYAAAGPAPAESRSIEV
jgi:hypothetical protein